MSTSTSQYPGELEEKVEPSLICPRCGMTSDNPNDGAKVKLCSSNYQGHNRLQYKDAGFAHDAAATWDPSARDEPDSWYRYPHTGAAG
jgi:hypothetical protein